MGIGNFFGLAPFFSSSPWFQYAHHGVGRHDTMWNSVASAALSRAHTLLQGSAPDLVAAIQETAHLLTVERGTRRFDYLMDPAIRAGYLAGYLLPNALRVQCIIDREQPFVGAPTRVLDLGAGPLSASIGFLLSSAGRGVREVVAVDTCEKAMIDGRAVLREIAPKVEVTLVTASAIGRHSRLPAGGFDAVLAANLVSEIKGRPEAIAVLVQDLVGAAFERCSEHGVVLLLEPGTRVAARTLMQLRDELDPAMATILAPCTGAVQCPLLGRDSWCHATHALALPDSISELRRAAGLTGAELSYSYLALAPRPQPPATDRARLVSDMMVDADRRLRYACTARGLVTAEWRTGGASGGLATAARGDVLPGEAIRALTRPGGELAGAGAPVGKPDHRQRDARPRRPRRPRR